MMPLPILIDGPMPSGEALENLKRAKLATGYDGLVLPCRAVPGSPGPILAVGMEPDWVVEYALIPNLDDEARITAALTAVLIEKDDPRLGTAEHLLSKWFGAEVKLIGEEAFEL